MKLEEFFTTRVRTHLAAWLINVKAPAGIKIVDVSIGETETRPAVSWMGTNEKHCDGVTWEAVLEHTGPEAFEEYTAAGWVGFESESAFLVEKRPDEND